MKIQNTKQRDSAPATHRFNIPQKGTENNDLDEDQKSEAGHFRRLVRSELSTSLQKN